MQDYKVNLAFYFYLHFPFKYSTKSQKQFFMSNEKDQKQIGNFKIGKVIGSGTFGKVRQGIHIPTGQKVAIKMLQKRKIKTTKDIQRIQKQLQILKGINHPNILKLLQVNQTQKYIFIVTELAQGQQLYDRIVKKTTLPIDEACKYFCQLFEAVKFLHSKNIAHRDIKPENIIVDGDRLKLIDFGLSTEWTSGKTMMETPCGSPCYAAPQMVSGKKYDCRKVDIWAMGVTLYAMLMGKLPFHHQNTLKLYKLIESSQFQDVKGVPSYVNLLLRAMIEKDPKKRIKISEIQDNIWIRDTLKEYKSNKSINSQWNPLIIKQMQSVFNESPTSLHTNLNSCPISQYATYYHLRAHKLKNKQSPFDEDFHDGPFHIQFVFKNTNCLETFLDKHLIQYEWVDSKQAHNLPQLNGYVGDKEEIVVKKKHIKIDGEMLTIKRIKNLPKLIYLPLDHPNLKSQNQSKKMPFLDQNMQKSYTHLDSSRSNITTIYVQTF